MFVGLGLIFYYMYGFEFLENTFLYHLSRKDPRHNFSSFFYPIYLSFSDTNLSTDSLPLKPIYTRISDILLSIPSCSSIYSQSSYDVKSIIECL